MAADPSKPKWPTAFSASVLARRSDRDHRREDFFRWFYDSNQEMERFDGMVIWHNEPHWALIIVDYSSMVRFSVFFQEDEATCIKESINHTMIKPDFSSFSYAGTSLVGYQPTYHWTARDQKRDFFQLWDAQSSRDIVRIDVVNPVGDNERWNFMEIDAVSQDPNLFVLPDIILTNCNSM